MICAFCGVTETDVSGHREIGERSMCLRCLVQLVKAIETVGGNHE